MQYRTLPQRQKQGTSLEEPPDKRLLLLPSYFAGTHPYSKYFVLGKSKTECGTGPALCVRPEALNINPNAKNIFYEIAHVHPQDYSLHVYLSPRDARRVVERGWGLRFPVPWIAPPSWVMVYAPRDVEELRTVSRIVRAACCFAVGTELQKIPLWPPSLHQGVFCRCNYCIPYQEERETYWRESLKKTIPTRGDP